MSCQNIVDPKVAANLKAQAALKGVVLHIVDDDIGQPLFVAVRWAMTRHMHSVQEVHKFLERMPSSGNR